MQIIESEGRLLIFIAYKLCQTLYLQNIFLPPIVVAQPTMHRADVIDFWSLKLEKEMMVIDGVGWTEEWFKNLIFKCTGMWQELESNYNSTMINYSENELFYYLQVVIYISIFFTDQVLKILDQQIPHISSGW